MWKPPLKGSTCMLGQLWHHHIELVTMEHTLVSYIEELHRPAHSHRRVKVERHNEHHMLGSGQRKRRIPFTEEGLTLFGEHNIKYCPLSRNDLAHS